VAHKNMASHSAPSFLKQSYCAKNRPDNRLSRFWFSPHVIELKQGLV